MKLIISIIFFFIAIAVAQTKETNGDTTYLYYHDLINKAEKSYFFHNNSDSAFCYYDKAFAEYSFIFLKDLLNAAQISVFEGKNDYKKYLLLGFRYGLEYKHLNEFPILKPLINELKSDLVFLNQAELNRNNYLGNINYEYLLKVYKAGILDQIAKNQPETIYSTFKKNKIIEFKEWIKTYGFPSAKIIGIDDQNIFMNIGKPENDLDNLKNKFSTKLDYYSTEDYSVSHTISIVVLYHNKCAFLEIEEILYNAMLKGEIHPREIGLFYDNMFRIYQPSYQCQVPDVQNGLFYLNLFCDYKKYSVDKTKSNELRSKWYVVELEVDEKKREFQKKYGFKLFYGFGGCM